MRQLLVIALAALVLVAAAPAPPLKAWSKPDFAAAQRPANLSSSSCTPRGASPVGSRSRSCAS